MSLSRIVLTTSLPDIVLRELTPRDAPELFALIQGNSHHLTEHGDYVEQVKASVADIADELATEPQRHRRFGILACNEIVGRVDLVGVDPPRYGLGYWLVGSHLRRGIATAAVRSVIDFAFAQGLATDVFAGVTHGNDRSVALLKRLEFQPVERFETYTRYHLGKA